MRTFLALDGCIIFIVIWIITAVFPDWKFTQTHVEGKFEITWHDHALSHCSLYMWIRYDVFRKI